MPGPDEISVQQLARLIGTPDQPHILDVRPAEDRAADPFLMPCARIASHLAPDAALPAGPARPIAVTCYKGGKFAQGAAALLRTMGHRAEVIEGGWAAWRSAGLPVVDAGAGSGLVGDAAPAQGGPHRLPLADPAVPESRGAVPVRIARRRA